MNCPKDQTPLEMIEYEGVHIETCPSCGGEWLDGSELATVIKAREVRFSADELKLLGNVEPVHGLPLESVDRDIPCPKCGTETDPVNYGGDTGVIIDRCPSCSGIWLDAAELEAVQAIVEAWEKKLPEDVITHSAMLAKIKHDQDKADDVHYSQFGVINALVNGVLDKIIR